MDEFLEQIQTVASGPDSREERAQNIAAFIMTLEQYRWVGVYDVSDTFVSIIAWAGPGPPAYPTFPVSQGLTSAAISRKAPILVNDVCLNPRYLTAFGSTRSEIIIPVLAPTDGAVIGTIDVESERTNAFSERDQRILQECALAALPLWIAR